MGIEEIAARREEILRIGRAHGASRVRVFGSFARGTAGPGSDVDFLVDLESGRGIDPLGGLGDLSIGLVRAAGPGTFTDDPLRIMRAACLDHQVVRVTEQETPALRSDYPTIAGEPAGECVRDERRLE